jgi:membrane-bound serine protease (ClpP class)
MTLIIALLIVGAVLIFLETLLPGLITGIIGFICLIAAIVLGYREFGFQTGNWILAGVIVGLIVGFVCWLRFFPESRVARRFISQGAVGELGVDKPELLNGTGVAITQLRPSGVALINGKRVDVVTEGGLIERGVAVKVIEMEGSRIVVRRAAIPPADTV